MSYFIIFSAAGQRRWVLYVLSHEKRISAILFPNVKCEDLCPTIIPSTSYQLILQEESHTIDLLSIQIDKYEILLVKCSENNTVDLVLRGIDFC